MNGKIQEQPLITPTPADIVRFGGATPSQTNPLPFRLTDGTTFYDARQIRALVNTDVVKAQLQDNAGGVITLGQKVMTSSLPVVIASNQTPVPVNTEGIKATYSASAVGFVPAAAATDVGCLIGSATKVIRILRVAISITTTAGSGTSVNLSLIKRSAANTGGTSATNSVVPHDSTLAAGTGVLRNYTANPSALGTSLGAIRAARFQIATLGSFQSDYSWDFTTRNGMGVLLRGVAESLCLNLGGATITGPVCSINFEWTEE